MRNWILFTTLISLLAPTAFGQRLFTEEPPGSMSIGTRWTSPDGDSNFGAVSFQDTNGLPQGTVLQPPTDETIDLRKQLADLQARLEKIESSRSADSSEEKEGNADDKTKDLLEKLESGFKDHEEAIQKIDSTLPNLLYHSHKSPKMQFFGRTHIDYWSFPEADAGLFPLEGGNPQDRIVFRRLRIGIQGALNDNMFYKYEGEFAGGGNVEYRDAYIGFENLAYLNTVVIGNHKRPYGLDHANSSRYNIFLERPLIVEAFNQDARRLGISSNGYSDDQRWNWRYGVWNQELTQNRFGYIGDHYQAEIAGRLAMTPWYDEASDGRGYAHFALSGMAGAPDGRTGSTNNQGRYRTRPEARSSSRWLDTGSIAGADANSLIGLETAINVGAFQFVGEYMQATVDRRTGFGPDVTFDGGYVQAAYFLTGEHMPWDRQTGTLGRIKPFENFYSVRNCDDCVERGLGAWQVAARYSKADLSDDNIVGGVGNSLTLGLNWYWNPYARMQFNYGIGDIDRDPTGSGDYQICGIRLSVDF